MLDKSDLEMNHLLANFSLSPRDNSKPPSLSEQLGQAIAALRANDAAMFDGDQVTILVLQVLVELLARTEPPMGQIPAMTGFDDPRCGSDSNS